MKSALGIYNKRYKGTLHIIEHVKKFTEDVAVDLIYNAQAELAFTSRHISQLQSLVSRFNQLKRELLQYRVGLNLLMENKLSTSLLPYSEVQALFQDISQELHDLDPQFRLLLTSPADFYMIQDFYIQRRESNLYLGIYLPVAYSHAHFNLYKIDAFPLPLAANLPHSTIIRNPRQYLAISDNRMFYFYPTIADIQAFCTQDNPRLCHYQPPLHKSEDRTCEYAIFDNSKTLSTGMCQYDVTEQPITPAIVSLNSSTYLIINVTKYTIQCTDHTSINKGCHLCILSLRDNCRCQIRYGTKVLLPQYDSCTGIVTTSTLQYPTNLMVVKHLLPDSDIATYLADTFSDIEQNITYHLLIFTMVLTLLTLLQ